MMITEFQELVSPAKADRIVWKSIYYYKLKLLIYINKCTHNRMFESLAWNYWQFVNTKSLNTMEKANY